MIIIDGTEFLIPYKLIKRKADMLYKFAERTEDGKLHSELIGVYFNYTLEMAMSAYNPDEYANLWRTITEPVESHTVVMPDESGPLTFDAYFSNITDEIYKERGTIETRNLAFSVIATSPARTP